MGHSSTHSAAREAQAPFTVFVYGTLRPGREHFRRFTDGHVVSQQPGFVRGRLYHLDAGYPALTKGEDWVRGEILTFDDGRVLQAFDDWEGYREDRSDQDNLYLRLLVPVFDSAREPRGSALAYFMDKEKAMDRGAVYIPSGDWDDWPTA